MDASPSPARADWRQFIDTDGACAVVRSCRVPVADLLRELSEGGMFEAYSRHPGLTQDDLRACFALAAESLGASPAPPPRPAPPPAVAPDAGHATLAPAVPD